MEEYEIDDFEKLYALTAAELNSSVEISSRTFDENDFDKICNLAKYKLEHPEMFDEINQKPTEEDLNYYMIPRIIHQKVRNGDNEVIIDKKSYILVDSSGNGLYIVMEDGTVLETAELKEQKQNAKKALQEKDDKEPEKEELEEEQEANDINSAVTENEVKRAKEEAAEARYSSRNVRINGRKI